MDKEPDVSVELVLDIYHLNKCHIMTGVKGKTLAEV